MADLTHDMIVSLQYLLAVADYCIVPKVSFHKYCDFKVLDPLTVMVALK